MSELKIITLRESVFEDHNRDAERLRRELSGKKTFLINLMASPGAGKTTLLRALLPLLQKELKVAVMEADIDSSVDAQAIAAMGVHTIQLHTGGMCHLDADMCRQGLRELGYPLGGAFRQVRLCHRRNGPCRLHAGADPLCRPCGRHRHRPCAQ